MRLLSEDKFILTIERSLVEIPIVVKFMVVARRLVDFLEDLFLLQSVKFISLTTQLYL